MDAGTLARELAGVGGAPGRPGVVHVVGVDPAGPERLSTRGAVLLRSATWVLAAPGLVEHAVLRLADGASLAEAPPGEPAGARLAGLAGAGEVVVRLVGERALDGATGLQREIEALEAAAVAWEVDPAPATGALAAFRDRLPLAGLRVLNPRARAQAPSLSMHVRSLGGTVVEAPMIAIAPGDEEALDAAVGELAEGRFAWLCLTSPNGVAALAGALERAGRDARTLAEAGDVACVGPGTARRLRRSLAIRADLVPDESTTAALGAALPAGSGRVLLPRADIATRRLADQLAAKGWQPVEVAAYRTRRPEALPDGVAAALAAGEVDLVPFASSSTVRNFVALLDGRAWDAAVVSIGPVTSATCREHGIEPLVEADDHDLGGLVDALCRAAEHHGGR